MSGSNPIKVFTQRITAQYKAWRDENGLYYKLFNLWRFVVVFVVGAAASDISTRSWPVIILILTGIAVVATIVIVDYESVTHGKKIHLIFRPWLLLIIFMVGSSLGQHFRTAKYEQKISNTNDFYFSELLTLTNEIKSTNDFFSGITNRDSKIISAWIRLYDDHVIPTNITFAEMKGLYVITNFIPQTNITTKIVPQTNYLTMTASFVMGHPILDLPQEEAIKSKLTSITNIPPKSINIPIVIDYAHNDTNAFLLGQQIAQIFLVSGFTNVNFCYAETNMPDLGVAMASYTNTNLGGSIANAYYELCHDLAQLPEFGIVTNFPDKTIVFTVATTTNSYNQKHYAPQRSQRKK